eukprot:3071047-Rhodomonas_salina.1
MKLSLRGSSGSPGLRDQQGSTQNSTGFARIGASREERERKVTGVELRGERCDGGEGVPGVCVRGSP